MVSGLPLFAIGLILLILGNILGIIPITFGGLGIMMLMYLPIHIIDRRKFKATLELKENKLYDKLLELSRKYSVSNGYLDQEKARLATYILVDAKYENIAIVLKERLSQRKPYRAQEVLRAFYLLAIKLGYNDHIDLYYELEESQGIKRKESINQEILEIVVPITKIYYLEELPQDEKCMVSGLTLDFFTDTIVVCLYCSTWAKKDLLDSWLSENDFCPVCRRELKVDDCPIVEVKSDLK